MRELDAVLSLEVRERSGWTCARCRGCFANARHLLGASHFFNKGTCAAVRFDPRNLDPLCHECHTGPDGWEYQKAGDYMMFMFRKLGHEGYGALLAKSQSRMKLDEAKAEFEEAVRRGTLWQT